MSKYQEQKENARQQAIYWQNIFNEQKYSAEALYYWQLYFETLAKRFGLVKEFKENGII